MRFITGKVKGNMKSRSTDPIARLNARQMAFTKAAASLINAKKTDRFEFIEDEGSYYIVKTTNGLITPTVNENKADKALSFNNTSIMSEALEIMGKAKDASPKFLIERVFIWKKDYQYVYLLSPITD